LANPVNFTLQVVTIAPEVLRGHKLQASWAR
jgi:hypothetical protein